MNNKFVIKISQASFELLMKFLQDSAELNLLSIINQFINFKVFKGQPSISTPTLVVDTLFISKKKKEDEEEDEEELAEVKWETDVPVTEESDISNDLQKRGRKSKKSMAQIEAEMKRIEL